MDQEELYEVQRIVEASLRAECESEQQFKQMMTNLEHLVKHEGSALVHLGDVVFLTLVKGKGLVEVHTMADTKDSLALSKAFIGLSKYLKSLGAKTAYTYSDDPKFSVIAKRTKLPFKSEKVKIPGTKDTTTAYFLKF